MKQIFIAIFTLISIVGTSQNQSRDGNYFLERKGYLKAISILEPIYQKNPNQKTALQLGDAFLYIKKYNKALSYYEMAAEFGQINEEQTVNYFSALYEYGDLELAKKIAKQFAVQYGKQSLLAKIDSAEALRDIDQEYFTYNLPMNTANNEYGLYPMFDEYSIINSDINSENGENIGYLNPFLMKINDTGESNPTLIPMKTKYGKYHNIISYYDENEGKVYITQSNSNKNNLKLNIKNQSTLKIFIADIDTNFNLSNYTEFAYNSNDYSVGHVNISRDGEILYFVSDKPGGYGGTDIYRCMKLENGTWGFPINLGENINTSSDEMFPYISPQGNTLYFSSMGHSIFGGLDLNKSYKTRSHSFEKPENLGIPFNSSKDDFSIVFLDNYGGEGFFSSNREGGKGGDDLYFFTYHNNKICSDPVKNFTITVVDKKTKKPISNVDLKMTVKLDGKVYSDVTDTDGEIHLTVEGCNDFDVETTHDFYLNNLFYYDGFKKHVTIELDKKELNNIIALENIYYGVAKFEVTSEAAVQLNKLSTLLKKNPDVTIELSSHTDSRGDDDFNYNLSQKRADEIVKYLQLSGINAAQLVSRGYGETKLVNNCGNNEVCPEELHEKNRRTEFKILEISK